MEAWCSWWLMEMTMRMEEDGGGARSCWTREEDSVAVRGGRNCCSSVWRWCVVVAGRGATQGRWNAAMADALWRRRGRQMQVRGGGARWWCGGRRDWRRRLCGGWKGN
ncbi:hypothetical protein DEO72_LG4g820 [Vigna unguiculata]|uniref:Uncharacterized protein n=1 Tax=Vigna unguiculata TaxID=3917 RepID=A0A4D6LMV4_VIGUN|nr:hypothetical protein DEO72_LG4g820 [Vigna unguiculata]